MHNLELTILLTEYLSFLKQLKKIRNMEIDDEKLLSILVMFQTVKSDDNTIDGLKQLLNEVE